MAKKTTPLFLVTNHSPHVILELSPYIKVVKDEGRTFLIQKKNEVTFPGKLNKYLTQVKHSEVLNYIPVERMTSGINPVVQKMLEGVSASEMKQIVEKVASFSNRRAGTEDNVAASNYIMKELTSMGFETESDCFKRKTCNIYARITGTKKPNEIILVEAHLDSVGRKNAGADDNASGVAGLLMIAKKIIEIKPERSFIFFATNAEESGLKGAKHFVKKLSKTGEIKNIKFVINMDMIGYNKENNIVDLETNKPFIKTAEWMAQLVRTYTNLTPNIVTPAWGSDHVPFLRKDIPTVLTIEHWPTKTPCYHSACDTADHLTYAYGAEIIKLNIAAAYLKSIE